MSALSKIFAKKRSDSTVQYLIPPSDPSLGILKPTKHSVPSPLIPDLSSKETSVSSFADCYNSLRKSYSSDNCSQYKDSHETYPINLNSPAFLASKSLKPIQITSKKSSSSLKFFKNIFRSKNSNGSIRSNSTASTSKLSDSLNATSNLIENEANSLNNDNHSSDIDESTALNTLYNLLNDLVDLNHQNRKKAEDLVVRFNFLQESFNELEEKLDSNKSSFSASRIRDKSDENTLKENTDGLSLMFFDDKINDIASTLADIKITCDSSINVFDLEPRIKNTSLQLAPKKIESSIKSFDSFRSNTASNLVSNKNNDMYESYASRDSYSYLNDKNPDFYSKKPNLSYNTSISNTVSNTSAATNATATTTAANLQLSASLPKYILLNKNNSFPSERVDDSSSLSSSRKDTNSYVYELITNIPTSIPSSSTHQEILNS
ncbi:hypothetical protein AYI69_g4789 [Smittium culicis]|uniref:Uncharacterized protein n=1 Tax=Smittium culicis TaxID=133412 RepID=A0A1R1YAM8_9FUNG|nr:hypothetical protein AYI69_g4789 [Smittium culicis]